jgi:DNA-binding CsgD family transcriptional regulator
VPGERQQDSARRRIARICAVPGDDRAVRAAVLAEIRQVVPCDAYVWVLTDPTTTVGASPLAEVPSLQDLPTLIRLKYLTPTNRWTTLAGDEVATLVGATGGHLDQSLVWRELLRSYGVHDVASMVLRDTQGCWGFLDLWRSAPTSPAFSRSDRAFLASVLPELTQSLRASLAGTFAVPAEKAPSDGPAVLLLYDTLKLATQTAQADTQLRALLPTLPGQSPVPAVALNVAAQLLALESGIDTHAPTARLHRGGGRWLQVRAARLDPEPETGAMIAVTIEHAPPAQRLEVYCRVIGLTARERELVGHLVGGADTRGVAAVLGIGEHTVNDHLRSIFAKAGVNSRRQLITNAHG